jgi:hypothetical protein
MGYPRRLHRAAGKRHKGAIVPGTRKSNAGGAFSLRHLLCVSQWNYIARSFAARSGASHGSLRMRDFGPANDRLGSGAADSLRLQHFRFTRASRLSSGDAWTSARNCQAMTYTMPWNERVAIGCRIANSPVSVTQNSQITTQTRKALQVKINNVAVDSKAIAILPE